MMSSKRDVRAVDLTEKNPLMLTKDRASDFMKLSLMVFLH